jgi:hypothetical protein
MGESVPNLLDGIFRVAYTYSTTGFTAQVNTSLDGNVTIGNSATNYSLLLNGVAVSTSGGSGVLPSNWAQYPAVQDVNISGYNLNVSGATTLSGLVVQNNIVIGASGGSSTLTLNGSNITAGGTPSNWAQYPAVQDVNMSGYRIYSPNNTVFFGLSAGLGSISGAIIAIGNNAATSNTASNVVAIGRDAATSNTGASTVMIGVNAGASNTGDNIVAIGTTAGVNNIGSASIMIGTAAGTSNTSSNVIFIGNSAGGNNRGRDVISIGRSAGFNNSADTVTSIGINAGYGNTGRVCTFIGNNPNFAVTNASDDQFIVYSGNATNPLIQGNIGTNIVTLNRLQVKTIDPSTSATGPLSQIYYSASDKQFYYY